MAELGFPADQRVSPDSNHVSSIPADSDSPACPCPGRRSATPGPTPKGRCRRAGAEGPVPKGRRRRADAENVSHSVVRTFSTKYSAAVSEPLAPAGTPEKGHWPALDGLRAVAVLAVIGIHVGVLPGGY